MSNIIKKAGISALAIVLLSSAGFGVAMGYGGNGNHGNHGQGNHGNHGQGNNGNHGQGNNGNGNGNQGGNDQGNNGNGNGGFATIDLTSSLGHLSFVGQVTSHVQSFLDTVARLLFGR